MDCLISLVAGWIAERDLSGGRMDSRTYLVAGWIAYCIIGAEADRVLGPASPKKMMF